MVKIISVKFRGNCRSYYFDPGEYDIRTGEGVIVETSRGEEYGDVVEGVKEIEESLVPQALKPVIRPATEEDSRLRQEFISKESDAFMLCQERIADHKLDMKLVDVEYSYNGSKIVFYFTADERVDFRDLVKDLAYALRTRIELRQIGVRDEAKMLGGLGPCGRPVCCKAFLDDFRPVSIKMAKEQNLSLSPTKISGLCGRLMCCLQYEQYAYEEAHKRLPRVGKELETPEGIGIVTECNVLTEHVKVRLTEEDGSFEVKDFACSDVGPGTLGKKAAAKQELPEETLQSVTQPEAAPDKPAEKQAAPAAEKKSERSGEHRDKPSRRDRSRRDKNGSERESRSGSQPKDGAQKNAGSQPKDGAQKNAGGQPKDGAQKNAGGQPKDGAQKNAGGQKGRNDRAEAQRSSEKEEAAASGRHEGSRRHGRRHGKPAAERNEKPAENKPAPAEKREITRLPGETIGMGKQEQSSEAPRPSSSHRSNLHRKHSFGPRN